MMMAVMMATTFNIFQPMSIGGKGKGTNSQTRNSVHSQTDSWRFFFDAEKLTPGVGTTRSQNQEKP